MSISTEKKIKYVRIKELLTNVDNSLNKILDYSDNDISLVSFKDELLNINIDSPSLKLAIAGPSNVGKSTLIKALTGEDVLIDSDVSTEDVMSFMYKDSLNLVDMPGVLSGNIEHDEIAKRAIINSDLLLFVLSNELFNAQSRPYFEKIVKDYNKVDQILLVVNQFDRVNLYNRDPYDVMALLTEELNNKIKDLDVKEPRSVFVSLRDFIDSITESDLEYKQELIEDSYIDTLIDAIDDFCTKKGSLGKLAKTLQVRLDIISRAIELSSSGNEEHPSLQTYFLRKLEFYTEVQHSFRLNKRNLISEVRQEIVSLADNVISLIDSKAEVNKVNSAWEDIDSDIVCIVEGLPDKLKTIFSEAQESLERKLLELEESPLSKLVDDFININEHGNSEDLKINDYKEKLLNKFINGKNINSVLGKGNEFIAKNSAKISEEIVKIVGKFKKFKPWGKVKLNDKIGKVLGKAGKFIGPLMVGIEIYSNYRDEEKIEKAEKELLSFKANIKKCLSDTASNICKDIETSLTSFDNDFLLEEMNNIRIQREEISLITSNRQEQIKLLLDVDSKLREGINLLTSTTENEA